MIYSNTLYGSEDVSVMSTTEVFIKDKFQLNTLAKEKIKYKSVEGI